MNNAAQSARQADMAARQSGMAEGMIDPPCADHNSACRRRHSLPNGADVQSDGSVVFRLWAPSRERVSIEIDGDQPRSMTARGEGWFEFASSAAKPGTRYRFVLPDGTRVPDPASRFQPEDVSGASEVIDPQAYLWRDSTWQGRPWPEAVLYELHVGTFTDAGTFLAAIEKLDHLVTLGVTGIELMPVADFPGRRGWGYDGVLLYAPDSTYGRPEDLKALVDAAHARGIMVLLDVVYNHFGPDGNYLSAYAANFFTERHQTPWGAAVNYDGENCRPVRDFIIHNALYWLEEFHLDGLRLDAVHAIVDDSDRHLLEELAETVRHCIRDRPVHLILENEANEASLLEPLNDRRPRWFNAQWNDDIHHVLHAAATGENSGYYGEYLGDTHKLGRALAQGFAFQGEMMHYRGSPRGTPSGHLPPTAFVAFMQNHDQIGNRAFGERMGTMAPAEAVRAIAAVYLLLPQIPMLFMGEEWGTHRPFTFFCDFHGELAEAIRLGRQNEFSRFPAFQSAEQRALIPDPQDLGTFLAARLDWREMDLAAHAAWLAWYRRILAVRRESIVPLLSSEILSGGSYDVLGAGMVVARWAAGARTLTLRANLTDRAAGPDTSGAMIDEPGTTLWQEGTWHSGGVTPWAVRWSVEPGAPQGAPSK
jgi:malto-oligosyltrehalose trehalohydrolase